MNKKTMKTIDERIKIIEHCFGVEFEFDEADEKIYLGTAEDYLFNEEGISIEPFLDYTENIKELVKIDNTSVRCGKFRQTIVFESESLVKYYPSLETEECKLSIVYQPFFVGIIALQEGYDREDPYSFYTAVELEYLGEKRFTEEEETILIRRFLYDVSSKLGYSISIDTFNNWPDFTKEDENFSKYKDKVLSIDNIPPYTKAMDYYIEALGAMNADIQFLSFYKVLEYFSPSVSKKEYYEEMNKRLDAMSVLSRTYEDINGLQELSKKYEKSLRDNEIPFTILSNCVDLETLFHYLPKKIQLRLKKDNGIRKDDMINGKLSEIRKELGKILYDTRNSIVHAKSNYQPTGNECSEEDMHELNEFMDKLCQCIFVWNGRQAENYRLK